MNHNFQLAKESETYAQYQCALCGEGLGFNKTDDVKTYETVPPAYEKYLEGCPGAPVVKVPQAEKDAADLALIHAISARPAVEPSPAPEVLPPAPTK